MRILIADDNLFFRQMLDTTLTEWGYQVTAVQNGEEAWNVLRQPDAPRLALLDWMMPRLDGPGLCRRLRASDLGRTAYLILLTSKAGREDVLTGLQAGADDFVTKPFDREELRARLHTGQRVVGLQAELADKVKQLERALSGAQKMEAVGRLAGGVAHDFNNLLTIIQGACELLDGPIAGAVSQAEVVPMIREAAERGATLTRQLLTFGRRQIIQPKILQLNTLLTNLEKLLKRLIGEDVELVTALDPDLGNVEADAGQLEQLLMNLVVNARDAMPQGGRIEIETMNVTVPAADARLDGTALPGDYVMLAVKDTGHGMDAETQRHIFEPFFTTKEPGKGTGLGLATVYGIVRQGGGFLQVESQVGQGATFRAFLPRVGAIATTDSIHLPPARRNGEGETILVVEDEGPVRAMVREILRLHNYTVLEARDGAEAIQVCEARREPIHLLLTDVVMPRMNGHLLADRLARSHPRLKVLYMSGYPNDVVQPPTLTAAGRRYLQKPFTASVLTEQVREALAQNT